MKRTHLIVLVLMLAAAMAAGLLASGFWRQDVGRETAAHSVTDADESSSPTNKVIIGDQAQKNLKLTAKPLQTSVFWKSISIQGMVVDRPGISDRDIVAPATGTISEIVHLPGDIVRSGDVLFSIKLASESLQAIQAELFKNAQDIALAQSRLKRLQDAGEGIAKARLVEVESEIVRLEVATKAYRQQLLNRGLTNEQIEGIQAGNLLSEISIRVPSRPPGRDLLAAKNESSSTNSPADDTSLEFEVQELQVGLGEQVQAGQTLCHLSNHQWLAIEGRAFRDETSLLERSVQEQWPVEVDFQEAASADWPPLEQAFYIRYIANTVNPLTRTFAFLIPLENQSKTVERGGQKRVLWRFRPGQKVRLQVRVDKLDNVFVLPSSAVVFEGPEAFIFTQNSNTFERKSVHVLFHNSDHVVIANDGSLATYPKDGAHWTMAAVVRSAAAQLNRMVKAGSSGAPKGYHIHADGSLHKNSDEEK